MSAQCAPKDRRLKMDSRNSGYLLMAVGVLCGILFLLINLSEFASTSLRGHRLLLYVGIVALVAGLVFFSISKLRADD
jgi:FtsH-binding integral membrane protein